MTRTRTALWLVLAGLLLVHVGFGVALLEKRTPVLTISFLAVGQGDAILIESPTGVEVLVDGGPDRSVLRELGTRLGPLDRTLDAIVATHPDADHISGLSDVLARYRVARVVESGVANDTNPTERLAAAVTAVGIEPLRAVRGMRLELGGGAYAEVLAPIGDVTHAETNAGSIVMRVVYGETEFLLMGDAPLSVETALRVRGGIQADVLKAGHHGSHTSSGARFLETVVPSVVVISAGKDNAYGHPHREVLERIDAVGARILATTEGTIVLESDGTLIRQK